MMQVLALLSAASATLMLQRAVVFAKAAAGVCAKLGVVFAFATVLAGYVCTRNAVFAQTLPQPSTPSSLRDASNRADYIVITHPLFEQELLRDFVPWRMSKGYAVRVVSTEVIYKEFLPSTGAAVVARAEARAGAIRLFMSHVFQSWQRVQRSRPLHVLLVGSAEHIPSVRVNVTDPMFLDLRQYEDSVSLDEMFVVDVRTPHDTRPKAAIGRFPARTVADVQTLVAKTKLFEDGRWLRYKTDFLGITDAVDPAMFEISLSGFFQYINHAQKTAARAVIGQAGRALQMRTMHGRTSSPFFATRQDIARAINDGAMVVCYYGHGIPDAWSSQHMLTAGDIDTIFTPQTKPFIVASVGCQQNFDTQGKRSSLVERLVNQRGGAVATLAASGYSLLDEGDYALQFVMGTLLADTLREHTLGSATLEMKIDGMPIRAPEDYFFRRLTILGDPALRFPLELVLSVDALRFADELQLQALPNPASTETVLRYALDRPATTQLEVLTTLGQVVLRTEARIESAGEQEYRLDVHKWTSGVYHYRLIINGRAAVGTFVVAP
jgi:hypothetical protein